MSVSRLLILLLLTLCLGLSSGFNPWYLADDSEVQTKTVVKNQCGICDETACPKLQYCVAMVVKDHCGCCNICSTDVYTPSVRHDSPAKRVSPCDSVTCPKYKICMENMQGLPLCTCPSVYSCRKRKKEVCGTDNITYHSRCHLRIAACKLGKRLKVRHKEACTEDEILAGTPKLPKQKRLNRRREKRRRKNKGKLQKTESQDEVAETNEGEIGRPRDMLSSEVTGKREKKRHRRQKRRKRNKRRKRMQYKSRRVSRKYKFLPYRY